MIRNLISVIVPVYQGEKHIYNCIESIQRQTYKNLEIIVVNDGSTDKTSIIIDKLAMEDDRVLSFYQDNQGVSVARNKGIECANGEFVMFVDADDEIESELCETLINTINERQMDLAVCGSKHIKGNKEIIITSTDLLEYSKKELLGEFKTQSNTYIYQNVWGKLYRSDFIKKCKFIEGVRLGEDLIFNFQYFKYISSICLVPYVGYRYFINLQSATHKFRETDFEGQKIIRKYSMEFYHEVLGGKDNSQVIENVYIGNCLGIIMSLVVNENYKNIIKNLNIYLNDELFCEKISIYVPHNIKFRFLSFLCRKKQYLLLFILGKIIVLANKFKYMKMIL